MSALEQDPTGPQREFYREQLSIAFRYSRRFSAPVGSLAEQLADTPAFDAVLRECAPGSLDCARRIGEMAVVLLDRVPTLAGLRPEAPGPWWRDLLNFERGWFLQAATTQKPPPWNRPRRGISAVCMNFSWNMPRLVESLKSGQPIADEFRHPVTLLFSRARDGNVCVVEVGQAVEKVFRATNNFRTIDQIAATAGISVTETNHILSTLAGVGAIVPAMSAEEMTHALEAREKR